MTSQFGNLTTAICTLIVGISISAFSQAAAFVQTGNNDFATGDIVSFEIGSKTYQGTVVSVLENGKVKLDYKVDGISLPFISRPSKLTKVRSGFPLRIWTDKSGLHKVNARFVDVKNGFIILHGELGNVIRIPSSQASRTDLEYINLLTGRTKRPTDEQPANPFETLEPATTRPPNNGLELSPTVLLPPQTLNLSRSTIVLTPGEWRVPQVRCEPKETGKRQLSFYPSQMDKEYHSSPGRFVFSKSNAYAATIITNPFNDFSELVKIDISTEETFPMIRLPFDDATVVAVSDSGDRVLIHAEDEERIDLWDISTTIPKNLAAWDDSRLAFPSSSPIGFFLDDDLLLIAGKNVVVVDPYSEKQEIKYSFPIVRGSTIAFHPLKDFFAISSNKQVLFVNCVDGTVIGKMELEHPLSDLAISPSGRFIAGCAPKVSTAWVWDLVSREMVRALPYPNSRRYVNSISNKGILEWAGNRHLLANQNELIDIELRTKVWEFSQTSRQPLVRSSDGRAWVASKSGIRPIQQLQTFPGGRFAQLDPVDLLVLREGDPVRIELDLPFEPELQKRIRQKLVTQIQKSGCQVDPNAEIALIAKVKTGKERRFFADIHSMPGNKRGPSTLYCPSTCSVEIQMEGKKRWAKSATYGPTYGAIVRRGETIEEFAKRLSQPNPSFFTTFILPPHIAALPEGIEVGKSKLSYSSE